MNRTVNITIVVDMSNGIPYGATVESLRKARGMDGVKVVILSDEEWDALDFINGNACTFIKSFGELDGGVIFEIMSGDTVKADIIERIRDFYANRDVSEPIPDDMREGFVVRSRATVQDIYGGYKYLISYIVPFRNAERHIYDVLSNIVCEYLPTGYKVQIIMVDDGSTDGGAEVVRDFDRDYPGNNIVLLTREHIGVNAARNVGLDVAEGRYVVFLNAESGRSGYRFEPAVQQMNADGDIDLVMFPSSFCDEVAREMLEPALSSSTRRAVVYIRDLPKRAKLCATYAVIRRSAVENGENGKLRFDETRKAGVNTDAAFMCGVMENSPIVGITSGESWVCDEVA